MIRLWRGFSVGLLLLAAVWLAASGCSTDKGSRDFVPGKGWRPN